METEIKKVFISYSWKVQEKVIELANRLIANGIDVLIDVYDLKEGHDKYAFMEQSVNDETVDNVLIICDRSYMEKANDRSGGVGDETVIISPEIYGKIKQEKFIPIAFEVDEDGKPCIPQYLKSRIYIDLTTEDDQYEIEYEKLLRSIYKKPIYKKPALGIKPAWLEDETIDLSSLRDILKQLRGYSGDNSAKVDFLIKKASDEFVNVAKQYVLPDNTDMADGILKIIDQTKPFRDLFVTYCEDLIYTGKLQGEILVNFFEQFYNELHKATGQFSYNEKDFEIYDFMIWEFFICATVILIHYERFVDLRQLLVRPYFLKSNYLHEDVEAEDYTAFYKHMYVLEEECKPKINPNLYTLRGEILMNREKKPLLTKQSIANADIVLYQLEKVLFPHKDLWGWFPKTYVYFDGRQAIWKKLISKSYCQKIFLLFDANTVEELKEKIIFSIKVAHESIYHNSYKRILNILDSISVGEIGTRE